MLTISEFPFDHCICEMTPERALKDPVVLMKEVWKKSSDILRLHERPDLGVTCLVTKRWIFVGIITGPYLNLPAPLEQIGTYSEEPVPVYLDGLAYAGLVTLQT